MKKIVAFLLLGLTVAVASCGDDQKGDDNQWFLTPEAVVSGTVVEMTCQTRFGAGVLDGVHVGFTYAPVVGGVLGTFVESTNSRVDGRVISSTLSSLAPETTYFVRAFADLVTGRVESPAISFETGDGDVPPPDPVFGTPSSTNVTTTTATLNCEFAFNGATDYTVYFLYKDLSLSSGFSKVDVPAGSGTKTAPLTGLASATTYQFVLCADWKEQTYTSANGTFTTRSGSAASDLTKYSQWAELPAVQNLPDDYYYAAHYCDGAPGGRNYSVCYSKKMRGAVWVAYPMHTSYTQGSAGGQNPSWKYDPAIPSTVQPNLSSSYKATGDGSFSRGHMLASNDRQSDKATNKQTFYYTNMSPQIQNGFNSGAWSTLEGNCHKMICSDTLYMVTGAYFANENKHCKDNDNNTVTVPTHYYKVLIRSKSGNTGKPIWTLSADQIECAGYWLEHKVYSGAKPSQFIKSVSWIEEQTGQTFFPNVPNAPKATLDTSFWKI